MEKLVGTALIGEVVVLNMIYAQKNVKLLHFFPYFWLISVFSYGWFFLNVFSLTPVFIICVGVVLFHFLAVKAPPIGG